MNGTLDKIDSEIRFLEDYLNASVRRCGDSPEETAYLNRQHNYVYNCAVVATASRFTRESAAAFLGEILCKSMSSNDPAYLDDERRAKAWLDILFPDSELEKKADHSEGEVGSKTPSASLETAVTCTSPTLF